MKFLTAFESTNLLLRISFFLAQAHERFRHREPLNVPARETTTKLEFRTVEQGQGKQFRGPSAPRVDFPFV